MHYILAKKTQTYIPMLGQAVLSTAWHFWPLGGSLSSRTKYGLIKLNFSYYFVNASGMNPMTLNDQEQSSLVTFFDSSLSVVSSFFYWCHISFSSCDLL